MNRRPSSASKRGAGDVASVRLLPGWVRASRIWPWNSGYLPTICLNASAPEATPGRDPGPAPRQQGARVPPARSLDAARACRARAPPHLYVRHVAPVSEHLATEWRLGTPNPAAARGGDLLDGKGPLSTAQPPESREARTASAVPAARVSLPRVAERRRHAQVPMYP